MKTSELTGAALDWAVAKCESGYNFDATGLPWDVDTSNPDDDENGAKWFTPSTDWAQGGPIIEREGLNIYFDEEKSKWAAAIWKNITGGGEIQAKAKECPTPLIAAMRCYVASKLGDTIEIPEGLR